MNSCSQEVAADLCYFVMEIISEILFLIDFRKKTIMQSDDILLMYVEHNFRIDVMFVIFFVCLLKSVSFLQYSVEGLHFFFERN